MESPVKNKQPYLYIVKSDDPEIESRAEPRINKKPDILTRSSQTGGKDGDDTWTIVSRFFRDILERLLTELKCVFLLIVVATLDVLIVLVLRNYNLGWPTKQLLLFTAFLQTAIAVIEILLMRLGLNKYSLKWLGRKFERWIRKRKRPSV